MSKHGKLPLGILIGFTLSLMLTDRREIQINKQLSKRVDYWTGNNKTLLPADVVFWKDEVGCNIIYTK